MGRFKDFGKSVKGKWCGGCGDLSVEGGIEGGCGKVGLEGDEVGVI